MTVKTKGDCGFTTEDRINHGTCTYGECYECDEFFRGELSRASYDLMAGLVHKDLTKGSNILLFNQKGIITLTGLVLMTLVGFTGGMSVKYANENIQKTRLLEEYRECISERRQEDMPIYDCKQG